MGRVEHAPWGGFRRFILFAIASIAFIWPLLLLNKIGAGAAWALEVVWIAVLGTGALILYRRGKAKRLQWAERRAYMASTGRPWFDAAAGHYRHGTCTIKHRSEGAAGRCSSTI
jgi:hypothetical protein